MEMCGKAWQKKRGNIVPILLRKKISSAEFYGNFLAGLRGLVSYLLY